MPAAPLGACSVTQNSAKMQQNTSILQVKIEKFSGGETSLPTPHFLRAAPYIQIVVTPDYNLLII